MFLKAYVGITQSIEDAQLYNAIQEAVGSQQLLNDDGNGVPQAFLNYMLFSPEMEVLGTGAQRITTTAKVDPANPTAPHETVSFASPMTINEPGFLYVYVSNESTWDVDVYFDDLTVSHTYNGIIQTEDYYPFGLTHNQKPERKLNNKYLYNGKELQDELGLGWYDYGARMYDAALGRWNMIDPLADEIPSWSPYVYSFNNPMRFIDPDGRMGEDVTDPEKLKQAAENGVAKATEVVGNTSTAACNIGVCAAFTEVTGSDELQGKSANDMVDYISNSENFEEIDMSNAQSFANDGEVVIAGKKEDGSSGHVVMVVPGEEVNSGKWGGKVPVVMDTGGDKRSTSQGINYSWGNKDGVKFFRYSANQIYEGGTLKEVTVKAPNEGKPMQPIKPSIQNTKMPTMNISFK